jgi:hypothetical protein
MTTNAITGVIILPSFVSRFRPRFITRYIAESEAGGPPRMAAASSR